MYGIIKKKSIGEIIDFNGNIIGSTDIELQVGKLYLGKINGRNAESLVEIPENFISYRLLELVYTGMREGVDFLIRMVGLEVISDEKLEDFNHDKVYGNDSEVDKEYFFLIQIFLCKLYNFLT